jgi:hypothetical protein
VTLATSESRNNVIICILRIVSKRVMHYRKFKQKIYKFASERPIIYVIYMENLSFDSKVLGGLIYLCHPWSTCSIFVLGKMSPRQLFLLDNGLLLLNLGHGRSLLSVIFEETGNKWLVIQKAF